MRMLIAIVFGCAFMIGVNQVASSGTTARGAQPAADPSYPAAEYTTDELDDASQYVCRLSPLCQRASQCEAYCAGGVPVCFQGCCACAS
jgi:hypothetical protein